MKTYTETQSDLVTQDELDLLSKVRKAVEKLPDIEDLGVDHRGEKVILSCHILARAVGKIFGLKIVDGFFYPTFSHSWLVTKRGNVIDVYPVGIVGGPIFVHSIVASRRGNKYCLYEPKSTKFISRDTRGIE